MLVQSTTGPRFGWRNYTHRHIDEGAIRLIPETSMRAIWFKFQADPGLGIGHGSRVHKYDDQAAWWKRFLEHNAHEIEGIDDMQDYLFPGEMHYLDMEALGNHRPMLPKEARTLDKVLQVFSPDNRKALESQWLNKPLMGYHLVTQSSDEAHKPVPNVVTAINNVYTQLVYNLEKLVSGLHGFSSDDPLDNNALHAFFLEIRRNVGMLNHFVGDAFVPLHSTEFFDYPLGGPSEKNIHGFFEGEVLPHNDPIFSDGSTDLPPGIALPRVTFNPVLAKIKTFKDHLFGDGAIENIQDFMVRVVQKSHMRLYDMIDIQRRLLSDPRYNQDAKTYEAELSKELKEHIAVPQIRKAKVALAGILQSAWEEAIGRVQKKSITTREQELLNQIAESEEQRRLTATDRQLLEDLAD